MSSPSEISTEPPFDTKQPKTALGLALACTVVLTFASMIVAMTHSPGQHFVTLYQEWYMWLLLAQFVSMPLILRFSQWPKSRRQWLIFFSLNLFLVGLAALHACNLLEYTCIRFLQVLLRLAVLGSWALAIFGTPFVLYWIWRRSRGVRKPFPLAKWWFACVILLVAAEPTAAIIKASRARIHLPQLPAATSTDEFHIAAIGESSMLGWPYVTREDAKGIVEPRFSIPAVYAWRLAQFYPGKKIVMHNIAVQGLNLKLALERLATLKQRPDFLLLYAGHNEFYHDVEELSTQSKPLLYALDRQLEASPTFFLLNNELAARSALRDLFVGSGRDFADHPIANRLAYEHRVERFRGQLEQLAQYCRDSSIQTQWIVPACAESVYEPDRSVFSEGTTRAEAERIKARYNEGLDLEKAKSWEQAAGVYREELERQPGFAELHFRLAECLVELGNFDQAREEFLLARDTDGCPTRANSDFCRQIAAVAEEFQIPHFDAADILRPETTHGIIDRSMIHDNVHPTLRAFYLIAIAAAEQVKQSGMLKPQLGQPTDAGPVTLSDAVKAQKLTVQDLVNAYQHTAADLRTLGKLRFEDSRRQREAAEYDRKANDLQTGKIRPGEAGTEPLD